MDKTKKLATNARYLAKFKTISIRFPVDEWERVSEAAQREGKAVSAYTVQAVRERMERDAKGGTENE